MRPLVERKDNVISFGTHTVFLGNCEWPNDGIHHPPPTLYLHIFPGLTDVFEIPGSFEN